MNIITLNLSTLTHIGSIQHLLLLVERNLFPELACDRLVKTLSIQTMMNK